MSKNIFEKNLIDLIPFLFLQWILKLWNIWHDHEHYYILQGTVPWQFFFSIGNICLNKDAVAYVLVPFPKIKNVLSNFECTYIRKWGWLFHCNTRTKAKNVTFLSVLIFGIRQLWRTQTTHAPPFCNIDLIHKRKYTW